jgi:hypothetical protein
MNSFPKLVELKDGDFSVVLPSFKSYPLAESGQVAISYYEGDLQGAFNHAAMMMLGALPVDKRDDFMELSDLSKKVIIGNWIAT